MYLQQSDAAQDQKFGTENMTYPRPAFNPPPTDEGVLLPPSDLYGVRGAFSSSLPWSSPHKSLPPSLKGQLYPPPSPQPERVISESISFNGSKTAAEDAHSKRGLLTTAGAPQLIDLLFIQRREGTWRRVLSDRFTAFECLIDRLMAHGDPGLALPAPRFSCLLHHPKMNK